MTYTHGWGTIPPKKGSNSYVKEKEQQTQSDED